MRDCEEQQAAAGQGLPPDHGLLLQPQQLGMPETSRWLNGIAATTPRIYVSGVMSCSGMQLP